MKLSIADGAVILFWCPGCKNPIKLLPQTVENDH